MSRKRLRVAQACDVPYGAMELRGEGRYCGRCDRVVADLTAMTRREAVALFRSRGGDLCGYLAHDGAGDPIHAPERSAPLLATAVATMLAACDASAPSRQPPPDVTTAPGIAVIEPVALSPTPMMMPVDLDSPPPAGPVETSATSSTPGPALVSLGPAETMPTAEDRALERRKRAARRPQTPPPSPHTAYAGMMMLDD